MHIGGVLLGAGMELDLTPGDYLHGDSLIRFTIEHIIETRREGDTDWIVMTGMEHPSASTPWRSRRLQVRVAALRRSLQLGLL